MNAGPSNTSSAIPISRTVAPTTDTTTRLTTLMLSRFQRLNKRLIENREYFHVRARDFS